MANEGISDMQAKVLGTIFGPIVDKWIKLRRIRITNEDDGSVTVRVIAVEKDGSVWTGNNNFKGGYKKMILEYLAVKDKHFNQDEIPDPPGAPDPIAQQPEAQIEQEEPETAIEQPEKQEAS